MSSKSPVQKGIVGVLEKLERVQLGKMYPKISHVVIKLLSNITIHRKECFYKGSSIILRKVIMYPDFCFSLRNWWKKIVLKLTLCKCCLQRTKQLKLLPAGEMLLDETIIMSNCQ